MSVRRLLLLFVAAALALPTAASAGSIGADLGSVKKVKRVAVTLSGGQAGGKRAQLSVGGRRYVTVARLRRTARREARAGFAPRRARYVRIMGVTRRPGMRIRVQVARRGRKAWSPPIAPIPGPRRPDPPRPDPGPDPMLPPDGPAYRAGTLPAPLPQSTGTRRYVSTTGDDSAPGTIEQPWRSIQNALERAEPGELVLVRGGVYSGSDAGPDRGDGIGPSVYASPQGRPGAPITIQPYPGERVVVSAFVSLPSAQWFRMSGLVIDGAGAPPDAQGVSLGNTSGATPSHVELSYNEIENFDPGEGHAQGILHFSGTDTALIGNRVHDIGGQRFYDHGIYLKDGRRVVVANNVVWNITGGYGIHIWGDFDESWVINNTVFNSAASGFTIGGNAERGYPDRVVAANNLLVGHRGASEGQQGYGATEYQPGAGNAVRHNLAWANSRSSSFALSDAGPSENVTTDPRFLDAFGHDFRLAAGSPAVDSAERFGLLLDAAGRDRDARPDRGAFERSTATPAQVRRQLRPRTGRRTPR